MGRAPSKKKRLVKKRLKNEMLEELIKKQKIIEKEVFSGGTAKISSKKIN